MNKKSYKYIACAVLAAMTISSCDTSLLDIPQQGVKSEANFYITDEDCDAALNAALARFRSIYAGGFSIYAWKNGGDGSGRGTFAQPYQVNGVWLHELLGDDQHCGGTESSTNYVEFESLAVNATNQWVTSYYKVLYQTIYLCNLVIGKFDPSESAIKSRNIAEAKFIRAFCHYELTTLWGNVPLVDHVLATADEQQIENSTQEKLWAFIEQDLNDALACPDLTKKKSLTQKDGAARITDAAVRTLLGKAYLWNKKYHEAKEALGPIIDSNNYKLVDDINVFYHTTGNDCPEYIWEFIRHADFNNPTYQYGWYAIDANWMFNCGMGGGPECRNYFEFNHEGYGWGIFWPTKDLYEAYVAEEGVNGYRLNSNIKTFDQVVAMNIYFDWDQDLFAQEGYFRMKWLPTLSDEPKLNNYYGVMSNTPVFRYADVVLLMAEACLNDGDAGQAETLLNQVRTRAHLAPKSGITMDDIKLERRLELAMEGMRFQDLKRWGDLPTAYANKGKKLCKLHIKPDETNDYTTAEGIYNAHYDVSVEYYDNKLKNCGWQDTDIVLPFPETEIVTNRKIKQNPGY